MPQLFLQCQQVTDITLTCVTTVTRSAKTIHRSSVLTHNHPEATFGTFVALLLALHLFSGTVQSSQWACDLLTTHQSGTPPAVQSTLPPSFHSPPWHDPSRRGCVPTEQPARRLLRSAPLLPGLNTSLTHDNTIRYSFIYVCACAEMCKSQKIKVKEKGTL